MDRRVIHQQVALVPGVTLGDKGAPAVVVTVVSLMLEKVGIVRYIIRNPDIAEELTSVVVMEVGGGTG